MTKKLFNQNATYFIAAVCMPSILLFNLYSGNYADNNIVFAHVLVLSCLLAFFGILQFVVLKLILGPEATLIVMTLFWAFFWTFRALHGVFFTKCLCCCHPHCMTLIVECIWEKLKRV